MGRRTTAQNGGARDAPIRLARLIVGYSPGVLLPAAVSVGLAAIFTRVLSTDSYGLYSLALALSTLAVSLTTQWLQQSVLRYIPAALQEGGRGRLRNASVSAAIGLAIGILVIGFLVSWLVYSKVAPNWGSLLIPALLVWSLEGLAGVLFAIMQAGFAAGRYSALRGLMAIVRFGSAIGLVLGLGMRQEGLLWALVLANAVVIPLQLRSVGYRLAELARMLRSPEMRSTVGKMARYGVPLTGWFAASQLLYAGDRYVIQIFRGPGEVGVYSASYDLVGGAVQLATAPLLLALHPFLVRSLAASGRRGTEAQLAAIVGWFALPGVALTSSVWLFGSEVVRALLGSAFSAGSSIVPLVFTGYLAWHLGFYLQKPIEMAERTRTLFAIAATAAVLNLGLNVALVPSFGYRAAAINTLVAYSFYGLGLVVYLRCALGIRVPARVLRWSPAVILTYLGIDGLTSMLRPELGPAAATGFGLTACAAGVIVTAYLALRATRTLTL
jgi:O-antigen/teichoic acid export membrane protein